MPVPSVATYSAQAKIDAHTSFLTLIDAGTAGLVNVRDSADVLLAQITLTDPAGTVNGTTGQLTLTPAGPDASANASGTAAYVEICSSAGTVHLAIPAQQGTAAVSNKAVFNTLSIIVATPVTVLSITIG
jgi:hypothetical protein